MTKVQEDKIEEYQKMVQKDFKLSEEKLDFDSLASVSLHGKYIGFLMQEKKNLADLVRKKKCLESLKYDYYSGRLEAKTLKELGWDPFPNKILKSEIYTYVNKDKDMIDMNHTIQLQEAIVDYLELSVKGISNRQWSIKSAVEYRKFLHGNG